MKYEANIYQMTVENHTFWVAESKSLKGCVGQGETSDEAIRELEQNELDWIETAKEVGIPIPPVVSKTPLKHAGKFALRLAPNIYSESAALSEELGISMNQYFSNAISNYNSEVTSYLRKPISDKVNGDSSSKIIDFPVRATFHKAPHIIEIENLEEM